MTGVDDFPFMTTVDIDDACNATRVRLNTFQTSNSAGKPSPPPWKPFRLISQRPPVPPPQSSNLPQVEKLIASICYQVEFGRSDVP